MDWKDIVKPLAPMLGMAIGGPFGTLASGLLAEALGVETAEEAVKKIETCDPAVLLAVKQAEQNFTLRMEELGLKREQLVYQDKDSARKMQEKTGSKMVPALAIIVVSGFFLMILTLLMGWTAVNTGLAGTLVGYASAKAEQVISFYFGSSHGSKQKTDAMVKQLGSKS